MKKRQSAVQKFSTFLSFSDTSPTTEWITVLSLERALQSQLQHEPAAEAETWALHFLRDLQAGAATRESFIAEKYLSAYLQEACYQAAQKVQRQFRSIQYKYTSKDLFQIGNLLVSQPAKLFRSYQSDYQSTSLESYARTAIFRFIGNVIYTQDIEAKREKFSDYGLLKDLSNKELKEALIAQGISASQIGSYCLARYCYSVVFQPQVRQGSRTLTPPSQGDLIQIATCYNQQNAQLGLSPDLKDGIAIQAMLSTCIQAARQYRSQRIFPIENNDLISDLMPSPWDRVIALETRERVESLVAELFATIPAMGQTLLKLRLGLNLTQAEIAIALQRRYLELQQQYQVARQLGKQNRNLLKAFLQQCQRLNPDLSLQDDAAISLLQESLHECLQAYCQRSVYLDLEQLAQRYDNQDRAIVSALVGKLEADLDLPPGCLEFAYQKIANTVDDWNCIIKPDLTQ